MVDSQISEAIVEGDLDTLSTLLPYREEGTHLVILALEEVKYNNRFEIFRTLVPQVNFDLVEVTLYLQKTILGDRKNLLFPILLQHSSSPIELRFLFRLQDQYASLIVKKGLLDQSRSILGKYLRYILEVAMMKTFEEVISRLPFSFLVKEIGKSYSSLLCFLNYRYISETARILHQRRGRKITSSLYQIFFSAIEFGSLEIISILLEEYSIDPSVGKNQAIYLAARYGNKEITSRLLSDSRVNATAKNNKAIRIASRKGHVQVLERLLQERNHPSRNKRVDPSAKDNQAIRLASEKGHSDIVRLLLTDSRVDPSAKDNQAIRLASEKGHSDVVHLLLADSRVDSSIAQK